MISMRDSQEESPEDKYTRPCVELVYPLSLSLSVRVGFLCVPPPTNSIQVRLAHSRGAAKLMHLRADPPLNLQVFFNNKNRQINKSNKKLLIGVGRARKTILASLLSHDAIQ